MSCIRVKTGSEAETEELGARTGQQLIKRGGAITVCLYGDLGAGKTIFVKGLASALGIQGRDIGSASFVIVAEYETIPRFYHIDLYRIEREEDLDAVGVWEYIGSEGMSVIEWAERLSEVPENAIKVSINCSGQDSREIIIEGIERL